jgi:hypothetical protein
MRFISVIGLVLAALSVAVMPAAAQVGPRVSPIVVAATAIDDADEAQPFNPNTQFVVTGAQNASSEASEKTHSCATGGPATGADTVWFYAQLVPGTVTLDTAGSVFTTGSGPSSNTVVSLYRLDNWDFLGFDDLTPLACNENGSGSGIINAFPITQSATYYIQVSSSPAITPTGASSIMLTATADPTVDVQFDEPETAKTIKFPGLPTLLHVTSATRSLDEPEDPYLTSYISTFEPSASPHLTNTMWLTFTLDHPTIVGFSNFYTSAAELWFSLFEFDGNDYTISDSVLGDVFPGSVVAVLDPGTYFLRVGVFNEPAGAVTLFVTFTTNLYLLPHNYEFTDNNSEGSPGAQPSLDGWTLKNNDPGPTGDGVFCDAIAGYDCYLQLSSSGAGENTTAKAKVPLTTPKIKKGDVLLLQVAPLDMIGTPNLQVKLTLKDAAGNKQKHTLNVTDAANVSLVVSAPSTIKVTQVVIKLKNNDTVTGNRIEIDGVLAASLRTGESVLRGKMPTLNGLSVSWGGTGGATPAQALPLPPPAQ